MLEIEIPGYKTLKLEHLVLDVNGTLALDGRLEHGIQPRLERLKKHLEIHMLTADTHGKQAIIDEQLGMKAHIITKGAAEKAEYVHNLGTEKVITMGNGANDVEMMKASVLGIAIIGGEGVCTLLLTVADVAVTDANDGLDLLIQPQRLRATLRR